MGAQGYCKVDTPILDKQQTLFVNAAIEGVEEGSQHLPWLLELQLPQHENTPHGLGKKADKAAGLLVEAETSAADSVHSEAELSTVSKPNKKRAVDVLNEVVWSAEETLPRQPLRAIVCEHEDRPAKRCRVVKLQG